MASKQDFTSDEWTKLLESPLLASVAITAADPSGLWGTLQEGYANASSIVGARSSETPLVRDVVSAFSTSEGRELAQTGFKARIANIPRDAIVPACIAGLEDIGRLVDLKAGDDAGGFKAWLQNTADAVAEAASEGGFLGFGGEKVSDKERATLAQIATALGLPAA